MIFERFLAHHPRTGKFFEQCDQPVELIRRRDAIDEIPQDRFTGAG